MHPRNRHPGQYDFDRLKVHSPELKSFVAKNKYGNETIDFANPQAVKALNRALLKEYYDLEFWDIPEGFLCPPIPGRADYIHLVADLLSDDGSLRMGKTIRGLDIGVGANCIYPIIGHCEYEWSFVGADINPLALQSAQNILDQNAGFDSNITLRLQTDPQHIFVNIIQPSDRFDFTLCNPPFHASLEEAQRGTARKWRNLKKISQNSQVHEKQKVNFGGKGAELWCEGGEIVFIEKMIQESHPFKNQCRWFTSLVSKEDSLTRLSHALKKVQVKNSRVLDMSQGQKKSRVLAWRW